jgi:hypothetical protein
VYHAPCPVGLMMYCCVRFSAGKKTVRTPREKFSLLKYKRTEPIYVAYLALYWLQYARLGVKIAGCSAENRRDLPKIRLGK